MPLIRNKRDLEGYVRIDHTESPGFSRETAAAAGRGKLGDLVGAGKLFEGATFSCSHCARVVIINPGRTRARGYCPKCDRHVCDWCEAERVSTMMCRPVSQVIDEFMNNRNKGTSNVP